MKTVKNKLIGTGMALAIALAAWLPTNLNAADVTAKGGATKLMQLNQIKTPAEADALQPGDSMAMVCAKCKTVMVERVERERGRIFMVSGAKHLCSGCGGQIETVGHGKQKTDVVTHTCSKCGDASAFCCATKPGSGPTKDMEKK